MRQAREGCQEAFVELVRRYHRTVRNCIARYIGDVHQAEDLAQDVFLAAYRGMLTLSDQSSFGAWLMGIARHQAIDHLRAEAVRKRRAGCLLAGDLADWQADAISSTDVNDDDEIFRQQALRECLRSLSTNNRQLIKQYYFDGTPAEVIAKQRERKAGTIRMALMRIRQALGECIQRKLDQQRET